MRCRVLNFHGYVKTSFFTSYYFINFLLIAIVFFFSVLQNTYANDVIPAESYCLSVINSHISSLSSQQVFNTNISLKHLLHSLVGFIGSHAELIEKFTGAQAEVKTRVVNILVPLTIDACTEYLHDSAVRALEKILGDADSEEHLKTVYAVVLGHVFTLINNYTLNNYFDPKNPNRPW